VADHYINTSPNGKDPYFFIVSGGIENVADLIDSATYYEFWTYQVVAVFNLPAGDGVQDDRIDTLEEAILEALQKETLRDNPNWSDLSVTSVSPTHDPEYKLQDNQVAKVFDVQIKVLSPYV